MPIKLSDFQKRTRTIDVDFQGEFVSVTYLINAITPAFLSNNPDAISLVKEIITKWDVLNDQGECIPPGDIVDRLSLLFINAVMQAVVTDARGMTDEKKD